MCYDNKEQCKIWKGIDFPVQNWDEEFQKFWPKYLMFELRKHRGVMFGGIQDWYKVWKKTDLCFLKWDEEFGKLSPEHMKVSKLGPWWHPFV